MRAWLGLFVLAFGCTGARETSRYGDVGGTGGTGGGEGGFLDVAEHCPCTDLGSFDGISVFTDPGTPCPEGAPEGLTVHAEFVQPPPHTCSACTCPASTCALPQGMHTNAAKCSDADGSMQLPFGPATLAEDVCSSEGALSPDLDCDGVPCVQSLTVPALEVSCTPPDSLPVLPAATWGRTLRECPSASPESCNDGEACEPFAPEGALVCLYRHGLHPDCPAGYEHLTFYEGVSDTRACDACTCSPPQGAACEAYVVAYSGAACVQPAGSVMSLIDQPGCVDLPSGTGLGSVEASFVADTPGTCTPGGGMPIGDVAPAGPVTLCCKSATVLR